MPSVFLSHNSKDKPKARELAGKLAAYGIAVWLDERELDIGDSLVGQIGDAILSTDYFAILLSKNSVSSVWVENETRIAFDKEIRDNRIVILPIVIEDVEFPPFLRGKVYADFRTRDSEDVSFKSLLRTLGVNESEHEGKSKSQIDYQTGAMVFLDSGRPVRVRLEDQDVKWVYKNEMMVRDPNRGESLYHASGDPYWDGDLIGPLGVFFGDGTPADYEDIYYLYRWNQELG